MATMVQSPREQFLTALKMETDTTLKVLRAYPKDKAELKPTPVMKSARELAWMFTAEMGASLLAIHDELRMPPDLPPVPATLDEVITAFEQTRDQLAAALEKIGDEDLTGTVPFPSGPGQMGEFPKVQFLWFMLCDQIHHRGQFSVYTRLAGGRLPSIYGPTADEPWF